ncbi:MAG: hypothetical protein MUD02_10225 [Bacteroidales bacterium]|jgi:hypothetical protein|nr:hypothetical protein [Bacteroidales bacterium]
MKNLSILLVLLPLISTYGAGAGIPGKNLTKLEVRADRFLVNGVETKLWGIRIASAAQSDENTAELIGNLDEYRDHGINCISVFLMGSSGGACDPFSADGKQIDEAHKTRTERIIRELDKRNMICVLGIFYQNVEVYGGRKNLTGWEASTEAVRTVAGWLKNRNFTNVILNIANEQNSKAYDDDPWSRVRNVADICSLCSIAGETYPGLITGAGGYNEKNNSELCLCKDVDVLLYDTANPADGDLYTDKKLYDSYRGTFAANNAPPKPLFNVEQFGAWSERFAPPQGNYDRLENARSYYMECIDAALENPGLNTTFHSNVWYQGRKQSYSNRFDMGGQGTASDPGVKWYFDYLKEKLGLQ